MNDILIRPMITEKGQMLGQKRNTFVFEVARASNKVEIKKAIEKMYGVSVKDVSTAIIPGKPKSRFSRAGNMVGASQAYKKAYVTLNEGDTIDFFSNV